MSLFSTLANTKVGEVERPKPMPEGHYLAVITGEAQEHVSSQKKTPALRFPFKLVGPGEDVDADEFEAAGGAKLLEKERTIDFWMTPDSMFRFTDFGKALGGGDEMNLAELAEHVATCGTPFLIQAKNQASTQNPEEVYTRFDNPTAAE